MKKLVLLPLMLMLVLALVLLGGCATTGTEKKGPADAPASSGEFNVFRTDVQKRLDGFAKQLAQKKEEAAAPAPKAKLEAATPVEVKDLTDLKAKVESKADAKDLADLEQKLAQVQAQVGKITGLEKKIPEFESRLTQGEKQGNKLEAEIASANQKANQALKSIPSVKKLEANLEKKFDGKYATKADLETKVDTALKSVSGRLDTIEEQLRLADTFSMRIRTVDNETTKKQLLKYADTINRVWQGNVQVTWIICYVLDIHEKAGRTWAAHVANFLYKEGKVNLSGARYGWLSVAAGSDLQNTVVIYGRKSWDRTSTVTGFKSDPYTIIETIRAPEMPAPRQE